MHRSHGESNPGPSRGSPLRYRCATQAPEIAFKLWKTLIETNFMHNIKTQIYQKLPFMNISYQNQSGRHIYNVSINSESMPLFTPAITTGDAINLVILSCWFID